MWEAILACSAGTSLNSAASLVCAAPTSAIPPPSTARRADRAAHTSKPGMLARGPGPSRDVAQCRTWVAGTAVLIAHARTKWTIPRRSSGTLYFIESTVSGRSAASLAAGYWSLHPGNGPQLSRRSCSCRDQLDHPQSAQSLKAAIFEAIQGTNRGIFGVATIKKMEIDGLLQSLEALNPLPQPTEKLDLVNGEWKLLYSTVAIQGINRTKLGLRDFISLGDFRQIIDVKQGKATNEIDFNLVGLGLVRGTLTIEASYAVSSPTRVDIQLQSSFIKPDQLMSLFKKNYDLLLEIFNPSGWLEITYVDDGLRVGRDCKGHVFVTERTGQK